MPAFLVAPWSVLAFVVCCLLFCLTRRLAETARPRIAGQEMDTEFDGSPNPRFLECVVVDDPNELPAWFQRMATYRHRLGRARRYALLCPAVAMGLWLLGPSSPLDASIGFSLAKTLGVSSCCVLALCAVYTLLRTTPALNAAWDQEVQVRAIMLARLH